jgi:hypothetical protein
MDSRHSPVRAEADVGIAAGRALRKRLKFPMLLGGAGGLGLLACVACCTLPILGAIGIGTGVAAAFELIEPLSAGLLVLGAIAAVATFARVRRRKCRGEVM